MEFQVGRETKLNAIISIPVSFSQFFLYIYCKLCVGSDKKKLQKYKYKREN